MKFQIVAENACMMTFENKPNLLAKLHHIKRRIDQEPSLPIIETVIGYVTLTVYYDFESISDKALEDKLRTIIDSTESVDTKEQRTFDIPVCYEEEFGMDLEEVAHTHSISLQQLISSHTAPLYTVSFLGFSPGFPFLTGLDKNLHTARKEKPRLEVPKGSVGIAGAQTGIYPSLSPGGWQIIGRTPVELVTLEQDQATLLKPGDNVRFYSISEAEYRQLQQKEGQKYDHRND